MYVSIVLLLVVNSVKSSLDRRHIDIDFNEVFQNGRSLPRFWTSTGLCPPAPRESTADFLLSDDSLLNLEIIGSLPNEGLKYVRIHWLLEMIQFSHYDDNKLLFYDFTKLDTLLDKLHEFGLYPDFELMGLPSNVSYEKERSHRFAFFWTDLTMQIASRYLHRYGINYVSNWRFESWNEPDLKSYNVLNFTTDEYISYIASLRLGLDAAGRLLANIHLPLRGPAGLFRKQQSHPFCWTIIMMCNEMPHRCPFDVITFHRKGLGVRASDILESELELINKLWTSFPNMTSFRFSNDEADPIVGWSTPREFQSNMKYGSMLVSTVLQHWSAMTNDTFTNLDSISHDNGFLSYHPFEFSQRTLLARFQMNKTQPRHVQYVAKPVYSTLGILANLGSLASETVDLHGNLSYIISYHRKPFYACAVLCMSNDTFEPLFARMTLNLNFTFLDEHQSQRIGYLVEGLEDGVNDPNALWTYFKKPSYPSKVQFAAMRAIQLPRLLKGPGIVSSENLELEIELRAPWVVTVRLCSKENPVPSRITYMRIRKVNDYEVMIFWSDKSAVAGCIVGYEVWFRTYHTQWRLLNSDFHTPFLFFQFVSNDTIGIKGMYRVRSVDMFGRLGAFSKSNHYEG
ncbi:alpha-L-iduronidase [Wyeomyia smithii]|uniref:alpha-L-iduronidase n=1 Tax=Wyeomyia smithii TaxID=174621 RepID=UPI002467B336|nr:alpha-L-iduronidase [Wyeomyia smithii]XP_055530165.1 alpha-L-iduronidase [Wyeomyia smithii]XP_055530166.1 alpha-L-iduronidase [Wyeomyia smithii]